MTTSPTQPKNEAETSVFMEFGPIPDPTMRGLTRSNPHFFSVFAGRQVAESVNNTGAGSTFTSQRPKPQSGSLPRRTLAMVLQGIANAVQAYTGLSPGAAATILALMLATYLLVSSLFVAPAPASAPPQPPQQENKEEEKEKEKEQEEEATMPFVFPDPVEVGEVTLEQLRAYDGKDPAKQILIAIRGQVYDVSRGR
jgi:hypothetical protein